MTVAKTTAHDGRYVLGIDGGGSKTAVQVAQTDGQVLGVGHAGASNYQAVGLERALAALNVAIGEACTEAGISLSQISAVCLGLAGVDRPEDRAVFDEWLDTIAPNTRQEIVNDAHLVLAAGTPDGWGIALICGTGAICIGRNRKGDLARIDGWGHVLGDLGSGYAIGRQALQSAMQAHDGRCSAGVLLSAILRHWHLSQPEELIAYVYQRPASTTEIAGIARLVEQAAGTGDESARNIVADAGHKLARSVATAVKQLEFSGPVPCALAGGVITRGDHVRDAFLSAAHATGLALAPVELVFSPVSGAVRLAQRLLAD